MAKSSDTKKPAVATKKTNVPVKRKATVSSPAAKLKTIKATSALPSAAKPVKKMIKAANGHAGSAPKQKAAPASEVKDKIKKAKLVRDSFTMPEPEYVALSDVKKACLKAGFEVKKSELLRIGVALIGKMDTAALKAALSALSPLKAGRPKKSK